MNQKGYIEEFVGLFFVLAFIGGFFLLTFISWQPSNEVVSGIAYNTKNDTWLGGNTTFSVRAGENTPVTEENQSSYCVPGNSPYKELVNKAAQDKRIKIVVEANKYFAFQPPWVCFPNVTVKEVK